MMNKWAMRGIPALKPNVCQLLAVSDCHVADLLLSHLEIRANQSLDGSEGRCWVSDQMKRKGQVLIWLDNKQLNGHWETVWMAHLALTSVGGWKKITYSKYLHCDWGKRSCTYGFAGVVHLRTCVPISFVCRQVDRWHVKSEFMAKWSTEASSSQTSVNTMKARARDCFLFSTIEWLRYCVAFL